MEGQAMTGDIHKPVSAFVRWVENFWDGAFSRTRKGSRRVPSSGMDKRRERRWRRRREKELEG